VDEEARRHNQSLPGQGGVFNYVNLHAYHYAGNNPVKYVDPDGRDSIWNIDEQSKTIEITIPVEFTKGTTAEQQQLFYKAAKEWEGTYSIVRGSKNMTLYDEPGIGKVLKHEIGHLFGLNDRYHERKKPNGDRWTPPHKFWEWNIMGNTYSGVVGGRNFEEGLKRKGVNKQIQMDRK